MARVYVVYMKQGDSALIAGVYSSQKKAQRVIDFCKEDTKGQEFLVFERKLDKRYDKKDKAN